MGPGRCGAALSPEAVLCQAVPYEPQAGQHPKLPKHRADLALPPLQRQAPAVQKGGRGRGRGQGVGEGERAGRRVGML